MGLIASIGKKSPRSRLLRAGIVLLLSLGAVAMAVPFLHMLSGSARGGVDRHAPGLVPRFLFDDTALFRRHIEALYNESPATLRAAWRTDDADFDGLTLLSEPDAGAVRAWRDFLAAGDFPPEAFHTGHTYAPVSRSRPLNVRGFLRATHREHGGDIAAANAALGTAFADWNAFSVLPPDSRSRIGVEADTAWWRAWTAYARDTAPPWTRSVHDLQGYYHERVLVPQLGRDASRSTLSVRMPAEGLADWELFVREAVHPAFVRMEDGLTPLWQTFLRARYGNGETLRHVTGLSASWEALRVPATWREAGPLSADWEAFLQGWADAGGERFQAPLSGLSLDSPDLRWTALRGGAPPRRADDQLRFQEHKREIRRTLLWQHYGTVWEILILHGRGLRVTVLYCAASVLIALLVNPMAAYALSRFRPKHTYAILLFLLMTMAFPPMVTQIPVFLLLRDLGLLNSLWALVLPGMAHGYSIFLLKGFFDSLPRDLYESASLDGAGELCMFRIITLALSKPILAVIALGAFTNAYTHFMFALLICQDERMWTLMVWLFQLQQQYGPGVMNAAFVLAAVPTLLVFLLCQNLIMRGIVVPTEK